MICGVSKPFISAYVSSSLKYDTRSARYVFAKSLTKFADQLGEGMSGKRKDTPQAAVPRRTVIYKEDLE